MGFPFPGPVAPFSNPPIEPQYFQPSRYQISAITLGITTIVTTVLTSFTATSVSGNYVIGQEIRLLIPPLFGSIQLNQQTGFVLSFPSSNQVEIDINSTLANSFTIPSINTTQAQIVAIGDKNNGIISFTGRSIPTTTIPGAFINISPI